LGLTAAGVERPLQGRIGNLGDDIAGLQELITHGIKGALARQPNESVMGNLLNFSGKRVFCEQIGLK
jgi:hypothetical protein